jgi:hypothetical protein
MLSSGSKAGGRAIASSSEFGQKGLRCQYANSAVLSDGNEVLAVSGGEGVYVGFDSAGEDQVVVWISGWCFGFSRRCFMGFDRDIGEQRLDFLQALDGKLEFLG